MKNLSIKTSRTMRLLILGAVLFGLGMFPTLAEAQLSVTNTPGSVDRSTTGNFSLGVSLGAAAADSICEVVITPHASLTNLMATAPAGWSVVVGAGTITWTSDTVGDCLYPNEAESFSWDADAPASGGDYSVGWQVNGGTSSGSVNVHVNQPDFTTSTKTVTGHTGFAVSPGDTVTYTITVNNSGDMGATGVNVRDVLPNEIVSVFNISPAPSVNLAGPPIELEWDFAALAGGGGSQVISFQAVVDFPLNDGVTIDNDVDITSNETALYQASAPTLTVSAAPDMSALAKAAVDINGGFVQPGDTLEFTVTAPNNGDMVATNVRLSDALPSFGISYVPNSTTLNGSPAADVLGSSPIAQGGGWLVQSPSGAAGEILVGESAVAVFRMVLAPDVPPSTNIDNTVNLTGNPSLSESAVMPTVTVGGAAHTVTVSPNMVVSTCDTVSYSITLTASGSDAFDTYYEFLSQDGLSLVPGSVSVTNTGTGATDTSDPDISGNTWTFNYDGVGYNPGNNPVWDVADGETVTIDFQILVVDCAPGAKTVATNPNYKAGENAGYIALASEQSDIDILEGAITVEKTSTAPPALVNDTFTYDIAVRSVGFGDAGNIVLSDNMRPGITYLPGSTVPPADSTFLNGDGSLDLFWLPENHAGLRNLEPGQSFEVTLAAQLNSCVDYDDVVTATWGCGPEPCQTVTATASVTLLLDEPDLEYIVNPNPITVPSCDGSGATTSFTVRNNGGPAYNLDFTFSGLASELNMTNFVGDGFLVPGSPDTIRVGAIAAGDSAVFTFDLIHNDNCTTPSGTMIFLPTYENTCGDPYSKAPFAVTYNTEAIPSVSVAKVGSDLEVDPGDTTSYILDVCFGPDAPTNNVFVEDIVPSFLTVIPGTISPAPTSVSGDTLRWTFIPADFTGGPPSYCLQITYDAEATGACGQVGSNQASATTQVPCGAVICSQSDASSSIIGIICPPGACTSARMDHVINGMLNDVVEVCTPMTHTSTIYFDSVTDPALDWDDLTFIADADSSKTLVGFKQLDGTHKPGVARFWVIDSAGDSCFADLEPTRNGADELVWDLSPLANDWTFLEECTMDLADVNLADVTIRVEYDLQSENALGYHFEYTRLEISGGGVCDATLREAVQVTIGRSSSTVGLDIPSNAELCAVTTLDITVDVGSSYESYDHVLYFSVDDFEYIDDPTDEGYFEPVFVGLPDLGVPTRIADVGNGTPGVFWKLGDLPAGTSGRITIPVRKRCAPGTSYARLVYDDKCGDDDTDNVDENPYVSTATGTPTLVFSGDVSVETTPETYFATADTAQWITYAINGGSGGAYNLDLDYQTGGSSFKFVDFQVFDNSGTQLDPDTLTIVYGQDAFSAVVTIDHVPAGETWSVLATAVILDCEDKDFSVQGSWGCNGDVCQTGPQLYDTAALDIPETLIIADLPDSYFVASCEAESLSVTLKNASQVIAQGVSLNLLLPPGLSYVDNTTRISINHVGGATAPTVIYASGNDADPSVNGQTLGWFLENVLSTDYLSPEDIVTFTVDLLASPDFAGGTVGTGGTYTSACGQPAFALGDEVSASTNYFDSTAVSTSANIDSVQACTIDGVDDNTFRLTFSNGAGNGPVYGPLDLQVDLPEGVEYVSFSTNITYEDLADGAQVYTTNASTSGSGAPGDAQTLTWSLPANARVDGGDDITVEFRAIFRSDALCAPPTRSLDFSIEGARCEDGLPNNVRVQLGPYPNAFQLKTPELSTALTIVDISGTSSTAPGDTVQATVTITNTGNGIARDLALQFEDLGSYVTFLSSSPNRNGGASGADIWTWNTALGELAPGASVTVTIDAEVAGDISFGIPVIFEARASEGCCQGTSEAQESFDINPETQLDIEKAAAQSAVVPGELVTYILTIRNHGSQSFQNVVIGETALPGMSYVSSQFDANNVAYTPAGPVPGWTIAGTASGHDPFAPGDFEVIRVTYRADSNYNAVGTPAGSGSLANTASIASVEDLAGGNVTDPDVLDSDDELLPVELPNALLDLDKVSTTGSVIPGGEMTYHVTVTNPGNVALTNVTVTETFPSGLVFSSAQFDSTVTQLTNATYQIATLEPGQLEVISLNFAVPADSSLYANPVVNTVNASGTDPSGNTVSAQEAAISNAVSTTGPAIDITKVVLEAGVQRGDVARYLITVVNSGADTLTNVVVTDTPDVGLVFYGVHADTSVATTGLTATIPVMPPGHVETISMIFTVSISAPLTVLDNVASVTADTPSGGSVGDVDTAGLTLVSSAEGMELSKIAVGPAVVPGETITYLLVAHNTGEHDLSNVVLTDNAPAGLTLQSVSASDDVSYTLADPLVLNLGVVVPGEEEIISVTYAVDSNSTNVNNPTINTVTATALTFDAQFVNATDSDTLAVETPNADLEVSKVALEDEVVQGGSMSYLITVSNTGNVALSNVTVTDTVTAGMTISQINVPDDVNVTSGNPIVFDIPTLLPGEDEVFSVIYDVDPLTANLLNPTLNIVEADGSDPSGNTLTAGPDTVSVPVATPAPSMAIDKLPTAGAVVPGGQITYLLRVRNTGNTDLTSVTVTDTPPANLTLAEVDFGAGITHPVPSVPTFTIPTIAVGNEYAIEVTFDVPSDTTLLADPVVNTAGASGTDTNGTAVVATDAVSSLPLAVPGASMKLRKVATESFVGPDDAVTYLVTVHNNGDQDLTNVSVNEIIPTGLTFAYAQFESGAVTQPVSSVPNFVIPSLLSHDMEVIALTFTTPLNPDDMNDPVINQVYGSASDESGTPVLADTASASVPQIDGGPSIDVEKSALTNQLIAGEEAEYLITVTNSGGTPLSSITVTDVLPSGLTYQDSDPAGSYADPTVTWNLTDLEPGYSHQILMTVLVDYSLNGAITNVAGATGIAPGDSVVADSDTSRVDAAPGLSSINIQKTPTDPFLLLGGQVSYALDITNDGEQPLSNVTVVDTIPLGTTFSDSDHDPARWNLINADPIITWELQGTLEPGQSEEVTLVLNGDTDFNNYGLAPGDTSMVNRAEASGVDPQGNTVLDVDTGIVDLNLPRGAVLLNKVSTAGQIVPGQQITYVLTVENIGEQDLFPLEVREPDLLGQGLSYVGSEYDTTAFSFAFDGINYIWNATGVFVPERLEQIRVTFLATTELDSLANPVLNIATAIGTDESGNTIIDSDSEALPLNILRSDIAINKSASAEAIVAGEPITYTITLTNSGEISISDIVVTEIDLTALGLTFFESNFDENLWTALDDLTWAYADTLFPGQTEEIRVSFNAAPDLAQIGPRVENVVTVTGIDDFYRPLTDTDTEDLPVVVPYASLDIQKDALQSTALAGNEVLYLLTVTNNGDQDVLGTEITETLPPGAVYVSSEFNTDVVTFSGTESSPQWTIADPFKVGDVETIRLVVMLDTDPASLQDPVVNNASVEGTTVGGELVSDEDQDELPLQLPFSAIEVVKIPAESVVEPGGTLLYTLSIRNKGNTILSDVLVTEDPPAGFTYDHSAFSDEVTSSGPNSWSIEELPIAGSEVISVWYSVADDPNAIDNPALNRVTVEATDPSGQEITDEATSELPVATLDARIAVNKVALEPTVVPGGTMSYELTVTNTGSDSLYNVVLTDTPPAGLLFLDTNYDQSRANFVQGTPLTWTLSQPMAPGDLFVARVSFDVSTDMSLLTNPVENEASVSSEDVSGNSIDDAVVESVPLEQATPAINLEKTTTQPVAVPGGVMVYTLTVTNTGNRTLTDAVIRDLVPAGLTYESSHYDEVQVVFTGTTQSPEWTIASLARQGIEAITVRFRVDSDGTTIPNPVVNAATVSAMDPFGTEVLDNDDESTPVQEIGPAIDVEKVATRGSLEPGGQVTYILTVVNNGASTLHDVEVTDTPATELSYVASNFDVVHVQETTVGTQPSWFISEMPSGAIEQIRVTFDVSSGATFPNTIQNSVAVAGLDPFDFEVTDSADEVLPVENIAPAIHVDKSATQAYVTPGEPVTYHLTVTNSGSADLYDVTVTEFPPSGLSISHTNFDNVNVSESINGNGMVWQISSLPRGSREEIRVTFEASPTLASELELDGETGAVNNQVEVSGRTKDNFAVSDTDFESLPIRLEPSAIQILKWSDFTGEAAYKGSEVGYHLYVVNTGQQALTNVNVTDLLPASLDYASADIAPSFVGPDVNGSERTSVTWNVGDLYPQEGWEVLVITKVNTTLSSSSMLSNRAVSTGTDEAGLMVRDEDISDIRVVLPNLAVEKTADRNEVRPGEEITYQVTYSNPGDVPATAVVVTDELPPQTTYVPFSASNGAVYQEGTNTVVLTVGRLEPGEVRVFRYQVTVPEDVETPLCIPNVAQMFADGIDASVSDTAWVCIDEIEASLQKAVSHAVASPGDTLTYTLSYEVTGPGSLTNAVIEDLIPGLTEYVQGSAEGAFYDFGLRSLRWELGDLSVGVFGSVTYQVVVTEEAEEGDRIPNVAELFADNRDDIESNEVVTIVPGPRLLDIQKRVDMELASPGDTLTFTMDITNEGDRPLAEVLVTDAVPAEISYLEGTAGAGTFVDGILTWNLGTLLPGDTQTVSFQGVVREGTASGTYIENTAIASAESVAEAVSNLAITLVLYTDLDIEKTVDRPEASIGDQVGYTVTVTNRGNAQASDVNLEDTLPEGFAYIAGTSVLMSDGLELFISDPVGTEVLRWSIGNLAPQASITLTYDVLVTSEATEGSHLNTVVATATDVDGSPIEEGPAEAEVRVQTPNLVITKVTPERSVEEGSLVLYTITLQNPSKTEARDVVVEDHAPAGFIVMPGTSSLNGEAVDDPTGSNPYMWPVGTVGPGQDKVLQYTMIAGLNAASGVAANVAFAEGVDPLGGVLRAGPAEARVNVVRVDQVSRVRGWVYLDCDGDGEPDNGSIENSGVAGVPILLEDGRRVVTDENGEYLFFPMAAGDHLVRVDQFKLPINVRVQGESHRFFYALGGGEARVNFGVCIDESPQAVLRFSKSVDEPHIAATHRQGSPERFVLEGINFDTAKASLRPSADQVLTDAANRLKESPNAVARVEGHTDYRPINTPEFANNYELSVGRASSVRGALIHRHGIDSDRLSIVGYGPDKPLATGSDAATLQKNRRVEILIFDSPEQALELDGYQPQQVSYQLTAVYAGPVRIDDVKVVDTMPEGLEFVSGSVRIDGVAMKDPKMTSEGGQGTTLHWDLGSFEGGVQRVIQYDARIVSLPEDEPLVNEAKLLWLDANGQTVTTKAAGAAIQLKGGRREHGVRFTLDDVLFDTAKADLKPVARQRLAEVVRTLESVSDAKVVIEGHTDSRKIESREFPNNQALSKARARSVRDYLVSETDHSKSAFNLKGFGPNRPVASNRTPEGRQRNRRVEIVITGMSDEWIESELGSLSGTDGMNFSAEVEVWINADGTLVISDRDSPRINVNDE